ncbi:hypothetical protein GXW77_13345 [Roseomonas alkaliterrae]|uniref:Alkylated DNA nucleotide flippase Atl1 n=1 Tax=Neoroseomonas alkaliterrae TaxID=1452450 RepID=A0A840XTU7_9PROT|nr:alkylated DNA nucleotide flippase Atl1 [Neoroseomonas alkaliterrae]MBR0677162.1 hypothetical protein [Neoroseomonas alkaliterrae]
MPRIVARVPAGRVVSRADAGAHRDITPRHGAPVLAMLAPIVAATLPWHRAVAADGALGTPKAGPDDMVRRAVLAAEGAVSSPGGRIAGFQARRVHVAALPHGVPVQTRPADAPAEAVGAHGVPR